MQTLEQDKALLDSRIKEMQRVVQDKEADLKTATATLRQSIRKLEEVGWCCCAVLLLLCCCCAVALYLHTAADS